MKQLYTQLRNYIHLNYPDSELNIEKQFEFWKKNGMISRVKRDVYIPSELLNKFKIACACIDNGVLCYHAALEYYLLQTQEFNTLYVNSSKIFRPFTYQGIQYVYKPLAFLYKPVHLKNKDGYNIKVTSIEQTIIDCLYNINLAGGIEELMYALYDIEGNTINEHDIMVCLNKYDKKSLYQRAGYLLSPYKQKWHLSESFFKKCKEKSKGNVSYLVNPYYCNKYDRTWNICIPDNLESSLKYEFTSPNENK